MHVAFDVFTFTFIFFILLHIRIMAVAHNVAITHLISYELLF